MAKASTVYQIERSWKSSPEVWGTLIKYFLIGVGVGFFLCVWAGCSDIAKDARTDVPCKPTTTQHSNR